MAHQLVLYNNLNLGHQKPRLAGVVTYVVKWCKSVRSNFIRQCVDGVLVSDQNTWCLSKHQQFEVWCWAFPLLTCYSKFDRPWRMTNLQYTLRLKCLIHCMLIINGWKVLGGAGADRRGCWHFELVHGHLHHKSAPLATPKQLRISTSKWNKVLFWNINTTNNCTPRFTISQCIDWAVRSFSSLKPFSSFSSACDISSSSFLWAESSFSAQWLQLPREKHASSPAI